MDENENEKGSGKEKGRKSKRLSGEQMISIEESYPACEKFQPPAKLPNLKSVLGRMRHLCGGGKRNMQVKQAVDEVAKEVYCKYFHDNICCITIQGISKKVRKEYDVMLKGKYGLHQFYEGQTAPRNNSLTCHLRGSSRASFTKSALIKDQIKTK